MTETADEIVSLLRELYARTLDRCTPERLFRDALDAGRISMDEAPRAIVSLGKCAVPLAVAAAKSTGIEQGIVVHPAGYGDTTSLPAGFERMVGSHPIPSIASELAARRAIEFVSEQQRPVLFLVSGGASACLEGPLEPHVTLEQVIRINELLLAAGRPIDEINVVRRHISSIKGGRLGALAPSGSATLVYSDVPPGVPELVGSGPTAEDPTTLEDAAVILERLGDPLARRLARDLRAGEIPETMKSPPTRLDVIADSESLVNGAMEVARSSGFDVQRGPSLDGDVADVASRLAAASRSLGERQLLISSGESTVVVRGDGRGGRCTELAARFALACDAEGDHAVGGVFGSSDGKDGSSPAAGVVVRPARGPRLDWNTASEAFARSASYELVAAFGEPIMMMPTGNNLRDIALVIRPSRLPI